MKQFMVKIDKLIDPLRKAAGCVGSPLVDLAFRLYPGYVFFKSGWMRLQDALNGNWDTQIFLFDMEHPVPGVSAEIAAPLTTGAELILPVFLVLGLFGRFGAAGMIIMTLVIEFTYQHNTEHYLWLAMLASVFIKGPGLLSLDTLLRKWLHGGGFCCPFSGAKDEEESTAAASS